MKKLFKHSFLFLLALLVACDQDNNSPINEINSGNQQSNSEFSAYFGNETTRTFLGTVTDINHNPLEGVTVTIDNAIATTDANGVFIIPDANVHTRFGYVKAEKVGYITGSRSVVPSEGVNKVAIILLEENIVATINSGSEETVSLSNGASVTLPGTYIDEDGLAYTGSVNVVLHHLDPADEDMPLQMPGMLYGANSNNRERMLQSYGMLAVELLGSSGEKLNLAEGSTAEIVVPLDASLQAGAPATIPLWYFNEDYGYWLEEGEAVLDGTNYVGTVYHFSFWNCDIPREMVTLCVNVTDENGNNIANQSISITSTTYGITYGYTNEQGEVCGLVPSNETLELNAYNFDICGGSPIFISSEGPFTADSSINITIPNSPDLISETVTGTFNNCNGNPVTDGYVDLNYGNLTFTDYVTDGNFEINLIRCSTINTFSIEAVDYTNSQEADVISYTFTTPLTNLGALTACNAIGSYISYQVDNAIPVTYTSFSKSCYGTGYYVTAIDDLQLTNFALSLPNDGCNWLNIGPYNGDFNMIFADTENDFISTENEHAILLYVNHYQNPGTFISNIEMDINFSGTYVDNNTNEHTVSGIVHIRQDN